MDIDFLLINKLLIFLTISTCLWVSSWVLLSDKKARLNQAFFLMTVCILFWVTFAYLASLSDQFSNALMWRRLAFGFSSLFFIPAYFLFVVYFSRKTHKIKIKDKVVIMIFLFLSATSLFTDLIIKDVFVADWGTDVIFGKGISLLYGIIFILTSIIIFSLIKKYLEVPKKQKLKIQYFLIGALIFAFFNVVFNLIFPSIRKSIEYYQFADYSIIFFMVFTAYAIVRHELMGIKTLFIQTLMVVISIIILVEIFVLSEDFVMQVLKGVVLIVFLYFGRILTGSIKKEKESANKLKIAYEKINIYVEELKNINLNLEEKKEQLQDLNLHLQEKVDEQTKEIKVAYEVEKSARIKLEELDKVKDEFITTAAHQLRTPLSATRWALKSSIDGTFQGKEQKELLQKIYDTNNNLINIVGDLLDTSSIENKTFAYDFQEQDISLLLKEVVSSSIFQLKDKKINVNYHEPEDHHITLKLDKDKLSMAFQNIVSNAIDYTPDGGDIDITLKKENNQVIIKIQDNGIGIPTEAQAHIFEKFYRGDNAKKTETDRSGLGLYISKQILLKHGGTITIESKEGEGTKVIVKLGIN